MGSPCMDRKAVYWGGIRVRDHSSLEHRLGGRASSTQAAREMGRLFLEQMKDRERDAAQKKEEAWRVGMEDKERATGDNDDSGPDTALPRYEWQDALGTWHQYPHRASSFLQAALSDGTLKSRSVIADMGEDFTTYNVTLQDTMTQDDLDNNLNLLRHIDIKSMAKFNPFRVGNRPLRVTYFNARAKPLPKKSVTKAGTAHQSTAPQTTNRPNPGKPTTLLKKRARPSRPVPKLAAPYHVSSLPLPGGGTYKGGMLDVGYGPQRHGFGIRLYADGVTVAYQGHYKSGRFDGDGERFGKDGRRVYKGEYREDVPHGKGVWYGNDGETYEGGWRNGKRHGKGVHRMRSGIVHKGRWRDGKLHGKGKTVDGAGRTLFSGQHEDGKMHGQCSAVLDNGSVYTGNYDRGVFQGKGKLVRADFEYEGGFDRSDFHGFGQYRESNGYRYEGAWHRGKKTGAGQEWDADGYSIKGHFEHGRVEGQAVLYYPNRSVAYEGVWKRHKFEGLGEFYRPNGDLVYSGEFREGAYDGYGNCYYADGGYYFGYWKMGKRHTGHGKIEEEFGESIVGECKDQRGWVYLGEWVGDKWDGAGALYNEMGELVFEGQFSQGVADGEGRHIYTSIMLGGSDYAGGFKNGQKHGRGRLTYKDGTVLFDGTYDRGQWHGQGEWQDLQGTWYKGDFINMERTGKGEMETTEGTWYSGDFVRGKYHGKGLLVTKYPDATKDGYFRDGEYLESGAERAERLKREKKEAESRARVKAKLKEDLRLREVARKRAEERRLKAQAVMDNWDEDGGECDTETLGDQLREEAERKRRAAAEEEARRAREAAKKAAAPKVARMSDAARKRKNLLASRAERAQKRRAEAERRNWKKKGRRGRRGGEEMQILKLPAVATSPIKRAKEGGSTKPVLNAKGRPVKKTRHTGVIAGVRTKTWLDELLANAGRAGAEAENCSSEGSDRK